MKKQNLSAKKWMLFAFTLGCLFIQSAHGQLHLNSPNTTGSYTAPYSIDLDNGFSTGGDFSARIAMVNCRPLRTIPSSSQNYIITHLPRVAGITNPADTSNTNCKVIQSIQYFDGLGRPLQTVQVKASPDGTKDIIQPTIFDKFGREVVKYLPYATTSGNAGSYRPNAITEQFDYYATSVLPPLGVVRTDKPFSVTGFEYSPLNRITEQGFPGSTWQMPENIPGEPLSSRRTTKMEYVFNNQTALSINPGISNKGSQRVVLYIATINSDQSRTLGRVTGKAYYPSNELNVTIQKDENWQPANGCLGTNEEYKDKEDRVVLKRVYNKTPAGLVEMLSTYYVYDDLGNLCFVLPPKTEPDLASGTPNTLNELCYQYRYDERNRLTQKKIPGKGWDYTVYNKLDQPVLLQDAVQRLTNQWSVNKYDAFGRVIMTGLWNAGAIISLSTLQSNIYGGAQWDSRDATDATTGYTITSYPTINTILSINYFDNYTGVPNLPATYIASGSASNKTKGLLTISKVAVLNNTTEMLWTVINYDDKGRNIQTYRQHYYGGVQSKYNYYVSTSTYDFTGNITSSIRLHYLKNSADSAAVKKLTIRNEYIYDHIGRKIKTWQQLTNGNTTPSPNDRTLIARLDYNDIGQLMTKNLHSKDSVTFLQNVNYSYNERGWLKTAISNNNKLNIDLRYNDPLSGVQQFNGNISQMLYTGEYSGSKSFQYIYDDLSRLTTSASTGGTLDEALTYDKAGNIVSLIRSGQSYGTLSYSYLNSGASNKLSAVSGTGFTTRNYIYDDNGNATSDGIKSIAYNLLNLPQTVTQGIPLLATYYYDAAGNKLRSIQSDGARDYIDGIIYNGEGVIEFIQTEEGSAITNGPNTYNYIYNLKDHLGNIRVSIDRNPISGLTRTIQEDEYYAFGLRKSVYDNSNGNRYLYNGKEEQTETGLTNQYDYGARFYDPVIARWTSTDPLAELGRKWSPYTYVFNNPMRFIDPDGMSVSTFTNPEAIAFLLMQLSWTINEDDKKGKKEKSKEKPKEKQQENRVWHYAKIIGGALSDFWTWSLYGDDGLMGGAADDYTEGRTERAINETFRVIQSGTTDERVYLAASMFPALITEGPRTPGTSRVGRWMSPEEYQTMVKTGRMVEGAGGQTFVAIDGPESFTAAPRGAVYVEFDVPTASLVQGGKAGWFKTIGPNASKAMRVMIEKQQGTMSPTILNLSPILLTK